MRTCVYGFSVRAARERLNPRPAVAEGHRASPQERRVGAGITSHRRILYKYLAIRLASSIANLVVEALVANSFGFFLGIQWIMSGDTTCKQGTCEEVCRLHCSIFKNLILMVADLVVADQPNLTPQIVRSGSCRDD
jgi:hypothetical protein